MTNRLRRLTILGSSALLGTLSPAHHRGEAHALPAAADTLRSPPVLPNRSTAPHTVEVTITAAPARLSLAPGTVGDAYAYNGSVPGPTLEVWEGDRVIVHFRNALPEPTTIHWHGLHLPVEADGSPLNPIAPGAQKDYVFTVQRGTAGTYWYHPHPDHRTGHQIAKGLYGALIVRDRDDPLAGVPEKLLILSDNKFLRSGAVDFPDSTSTVGRVDRENGREGNVLLVNGQVSPAIDIRSGEVQRWRIINASAARVYRLAIPGHTLLHVGSDGGLFERPASVSHLVLANSERAEVLVRGTGAPRQRATLQTLPYDRYVPQTRPADWMRPRDILTLRYSADPPLHPVGIPGRLRHIEAIDTTRATVRRTITLMQILINGKVMDADRVDVRAKLGATEIWELENVVGMDHPFHLHGFRFQVLDVNGVPESQPRWKDTVNVPKHGTARIIVRFDDYRGKWMFHCHILDHEDHGMMGILEVS